MGFSSMLCILNGFPFIDCYSAAQKNQLKDQGFDISPYGVSKIGVSLMTPLQQKEFDARGAEDIVVNAVSLLDKEIQNNQILDQDWF